MTTVDNLLTRIGEHGIDGLSTAMDTRDKRILRSLYKQICSDVFLTENQATLLVKILKENLQFLPFPGISKLDTPTWSKPFRKIQQVRKMRINAESTEIIVEVTYNKRIRQIISDLQKQVDGNIYSDSTTKYMLPLTEKNIYIVMTQLRRYGFDVDQTLVDYYTQVSDIIKNSEHPFKFENLKLDEPIMSKLTAEIDVTNTLQVLDRRIRYQYATASINPSTLTEKIAYRDSARVYIDSKANSLESVLASLHELNRFPLLLIMNSYSAEESQATLLEMDAAIKKLGITDPKIGIYFRLPNASTGQPFNATIHDLKYNQRFGPDTTIAGISNSQVPKFLFHEKWYPRSVISFVNNFKNNKASAYCDAVDLIVYYNKQQPMSTDIDEIV